MNERPRVLIVQHVGAEGPGRILDAIEGASASARVLRVDLGEPVPSSLDGFAGLVVMGGPMGVADVERLSHLRDELVLIERALRRGAPLLGVCLGSQLVAAALGARVYASGAKEIGWLDVRQTAAGRSDRAFAGVASRFRALHWHGDIFDLPHGATSLARSEQTEHQAFRAREGALGLLFHLEATPQQVAQMAAAFPDELQDAGVDAAALVASSDTFAAEVEPIARSVFGHWAAQLGSGTVT
jgi:GMP synthase (glutamine-hydrolysing)